jgi:hypothetical protein
MHHTPVEAMGTAMAAARRQRKQWRQQWRLGEIQQSTKNGTTERAMAMKTACCTRSFSGIVLSVFRG